MARWQPSRSDVVSEYAREVLAVHPRGRLLIGLDGIERVEAGSGPSDREAFAADLAAAIAAEGVPAAAVSTAGFIHEPLAADPARLIDEAALRKDLVQPYRRGEPVALPQADGRTGAAFEPGERGALVVSGPFLHVGDLAGLWHSSAWIQLPRETAAERDAARLPGVDPAPWAALVDLAFRRLDARKLANATFDLTDPEHPRRRFEDAC